MAPDTVSILAGALTQAEWARIGAIVVGVPIAIALVFNLALWLTGHVWSWVSAKCNAPSPSQNTGGK